MKMPGCNLLLYPININITKMGFPDLSIQFLLPTAFPHDFIMNKTSDSYPMLWFLWAAFLLP